MGGAFDVMATPKLRTAECCKAQTDVVVEHLDFGATPKLRTASGLTAVKLGVTWWVYSRIWVRPRSGEQTQVVKL